MRKSDSPPFTRRGFLTRRQYMSRQLTKGAEPLKGIESKIDVTECFLVQPMLEFDAGRIGNALLCDGDHGNARGFNPGIKLIRDKTLMLGHDCCNHRYVLQG